MITSFVKSQSRTIGNKGGRRNQINKGEMKKKMNKVGDQNNKGKKVESEEIIQPNSKTNKKEEQTR